MTGREDIVRLHQVGAGLTRRIEPDAAGRAEIARILDLAALDAFSADMTLEPIEVGWRLSGRITADATQTCGLTLEPLPVHIDRTFSLTLAEAVEVHGDEIVVDLEADDSPDLIEDGRVDLGLYAVEQLALSLDPFPRKPGAVFVQPEQPAEASPFAVLGALRNKGGSEQG